MILQAKYNTIDLTKMLMAFFVVGIHVNSVCPADYPLIIKFVVSTAVPFFFVVSGFLLQNKIIRKNNVYDVLRENIKRTLRLYALWLVVYFPFSLYRYWINDHGFVFDIVSYLYSIILVGETSYAWPLWYLLGLIVAVTIIYFLHRLGMSLFKIWTIAMILMLLGYFLKQGLDSTNSVVYGICRFNKFLFGEADRNGLYRGFALVSSGMLIRQYYEKLDHSLLTGFMFLCISFILYYFDLPFPLFFSGTGIFLMVTSFNMIDRSLWPKLREQSIWIYFIHMHIIFILDKTIAYQIVSLENIFFVWIAVFGITWIIAMGLSFLRKYKYLRCLSSLIE